MKFATKAIRTGQEPDSLTGSVTVPVYQTSTYQQLAIGKHKGYEYSRTGNPTRKALEEAVASLEEGKYGLAFASGVSATTAVFSLLKTGDHVICGDDIYGGTYRLLEYMLRQWGLEVTYADSREAGSFADAVKGNTKLIWIETPTNPLLKIIDIRALSHIAKQQTYFWRLTIPLPARIFSSRCRAGTLGLLAHSPGHKNTGREDAAARKKRAFLNG